MAYEVLSDVNKRKLYDAVGEVGLRGGRQDSSADVDSESESSDDDLLFNQSYRFSSSSFSFFFSSSGMRHGSGTWCSDSDDESDQEVLYMSGSDPDSGVFCQNNWQQENEHELTSSSDSEVDDLDDDSSHNAYHKFKVIVEDVDSRSDSSDSEDIVHDIGFRQGRSNNYPKRSREEWTTPSRRAKRSRFYSSECTEHYYDSESDLEVTEVYQNGSVR